MVVYYGKKAMCQSREIIMRFTCTAKVNVPHCSASLHGIQCLSSANPEKPIAGFCHKIQSFMSKTMIFLT